MQRKIGWYFVYTNKAWIQAFWPADLMGRWTDLEGRPLNYPVTRVFETRIELANIPPQEAMWRRVQEFQKTTNGYSPAELISHLQTNYNLIPK